MTAFQLALKWWKAAKGRFCKFGSFPPHLTHRQLDWSTKMFFESPFHGYPTCLIFAHVVSWSTALWTARTTRRRRPGRYLTLECITSVEIFFTRMWFAVVRVAILEVFFCTFNMPNIPYHIKYMRFGCRRHGGRQGQQDEVDQGGTWPQDVSHQLKFFN